MSYLVVKNDTERKSYSLTDQWETKPYLKVKDGNNVEGILPLTTDPEEAITVTETYTHTYETSAETPEGLTDTTALTVESTSGTSYLTESVSHEMIQISGSEVSSYSTYNINNITQCTTSFFSNYTSRTIVATRSEQTYDAYTYIRSDIYATGIYGTQRSFTSSYSNQSKSIINDSGTSTINQGGQTANQRAILYKESSSTKVNSTSVTTMSNDVYRTYISYTTSSKGYNYNYNFYETYSNSALYGTTYDLRTSVESTTGTSYLTCESTYGYSGKTSSSETLTRSGYEMRLVNKVPVTYTTQVESRVTTTSTSQTYRGLYYKVDGYISTWYTTAEQSSALESVTALTCESTTSTEYETATESQSTYISYSQSNKYGVNGDLGLGTYVITRIVGSGTGIVNFNNQFLYTYTSYRGSAKYTTKMASNTNNSRSGTRTQNTAYYITNNTTTYFSDGGQGGQATWWLTLANINNSRWTSIYTAAGTPGAVYLSTVYGTFITNPEKTITTATNYYTAEVTTAYSGISSSGSSSSTWE